MLLWFLVWVALSKAAHRRKSHWSLIMMSNSKHFFKAWLKISFYIWIAECLDWFSVIKWDNWFSQYAQQGSTHTGQLSCNCKVHCLRHNNLHKPCAQLLEESHLLHVAHVRSWPQTCHLLLHCVHCIHWHHSLSILPKLPVAWQKLHKDGPMANRPPAECICFLICWTSSWTTLLVVLDCLHWSSQLL